MCPATQKSSFFHVFQGEKLFKLGFVEFLRDTIRHPPPQFVCFCCSPFPAKDSGSLGRSIHVMPKWSHITGIPRQNQPSRAAVEPELLDSN